MKLRAFYNVEFGDGLRLSVHTKPNSTDPLCDAVVVIPLDSAEQAAWIASAEGSDILDPARIEIPLTAFIRIANAVAEVRRVFGDKRANCLEHGLWVVVDGPRSPRCPKCVEIELADDAAKRLGEKR